MHEKDTHAQVWAQIPWLVNGRASPIERELAEQHLKHCPDCQEELDRQHSLAHALKTMPGGYSGDVDKAWSALSHRLPAQTPRPVAAAHSGVSRRWVRWLGGLVAVEAVAVAALALVIVKPTLHRGPEEGFMTLSTPSATPPQSVRWRVLPDPTQSLAQWQANMAAHQVQVVGGPSAAGVWNLAWAGAQEPDVEAVAQALRASPGVRFVEVMAHAQ